MSGRVFLEFGKIIGAHGIKGDVKVLHWADEHTIFSDIHRLFFSSSLSDFRRIDMLRLFKKFLIIKFFGINTRELAASFVGKVLYLNRFDVVLPEGRYFVEDLIGSLVYDFDHRDLCYGRIINIFKSGSNDVYELLDDFDVKRFVPALDNVILRTDIENRSVFIRPLNGLF